MEHKDNPAYEYHISQATQEANFIFFDEDGGQDTLDKSLGYTRLIFKMFLDAANGDMVRLQTLMILFAGYSLREVSVINKRSHESNRAVLESIKKTYPLLYEVVKTQKYKVPAIVPKLDCRKYSIYNSITKKTTTHNFGREVADKIGITYKHFKDNVIPYQKKNQPFKEIFFVKRLKKVEQSQEDKD